MESTSLYEVDLRVEKIRFSGPHFFFVCVCVFLVETLGVMRHHKEMYSSPSDTFFRNHEPNRVPERTFCLSYLQNMPTYYPLVNSKLSVRSFLEYCYTVFFVKLCSYKNVWCMIQMCTKFF